MRRHLIAILAAGSVLSASSCGLALDAAQPGTTTTTSPATSGGGGPSPTTAITGIGSGPSTPIGANGDATTATTVPFQAPLWCDQYTLFTTRGSELLRATDVAQMVERLNQMVNALEAVASSADGQMRDATEPVIGLLEGLRDSIRPVATVGDGFGMLRELVDQDGASIQLLVSLGGETCTGLPASADFNLVPG